MPVSCDFTDKTILLAGAGCAVGRLLAFAYASRGARVIAMDRDEALALEIATGNPARIEALKLDLMRDANCRLLGDIWQAEPVDVLIHLQPLREPHRMGAAIQAIPALTRQLQPALEAGSGRVLVLYCEAASEARAEGRTFATAFAHLVEHLNAEISQSGLTVNAIRVATDCDGTVCDDLITAAAMFLTGPKARGAGGTVLLVSP